MKALNLAITAIAALTLISCGGGEKISGGTDTPGGTDVRLTVSPSTMTGEAAYGHDITFTVTSKNQAEASFAGNSWAKVKSLTAGSNNTWTLVASLDFNDSDDQRVDTLILKSGTQLAKATVKQSGLASLIGTSTEVTVESMTPSTISIKLPFDWTMSLTDTKSVSEWMEISPTSGKKNTKTDITFIPLTMNLAKEARKAYAKISVTGGDFHLNVSQTSSLPSESFLDSKVYGLYNVDGKGGNILYEEFTHQLNIRTDTERRFRIVWPTGDKVIEFSGIPTSFTQNDIVDFNVNQSWSSIIPGSYEVSAQVAQVDGEFAWLVDGKKEGFVIINTPKK